MNKVKEIKNVFFNLENSSKKKKDGEETTDANVILNEINIFYSDL